LCGYPPERSLPHLHRAAQFTVRARRWRRPAGRWVLVAAASASAYENHVLVCAVTRGRTPVLKVLPWPHDASARVLRFAFTDDGRFLLAGTLGGAVHVVAARDLMAAEVVAVQRASTRGGGGGSMPTPTTSASADPPVRALCTAGPQLVALLWWRRSADAAAVAVAVTRTGEVRLWSAVTAQPLCACVVTGRVDSALLVRGLGCQYLLLSGDSGEFFQGSTHTHWTLTLEMERGGNLPHGEGPSGIQSLPEAIGLPGFAPEVVHGLFGIANPRGAPSPGRLGSGLGVGGNGDGDGGARAVLAVHEHGGDGGGALVSRRDPVAHTLQLYDPLRPEHPVFLLRLPPNTVQVRALDTHVSPRPTGSGYESVCDHSGILCSCAASQKLGAHGSQFRLWVNSCRRILSFARTLPSKKDDYTRTGAAQQLLYQQGNFKFL
jgi:hypothetical protein